jgi:hypothetical protein
MPVDDEGYEPALDSAPPQEASVEAEPVVKRASPAAAAQAEAKLGEPPGEDDIGAVEVGPRAPRVWNAKSRAMFRDVVKQVQAGEVSTEGDLEPMVHAPVAPASPPAAVAPVASPAPPQAPPAAASAASPVTPPPGLPPLPDLPLPALPQASPAPDPGHAEREAALAAREAAVAEREKIWPDRTAVAERPAATFVSWLRDAQGITDDAEMKTVLTDFVTELSEIGLGVKLPDEVKAAMEGRKALRTVKVYTANLTREQQKLAADRAAAEKQATEARAAEEAKQRDAAYVNRIAELIAPAAAQHKFLHDPEVTGGLAPQVIVYEVLKEQQRLGQKPDLGTATEYANNYYKAQAEAAAKKAAHFQSLLAPAAPAPAAAPAKAATSPGGAPGPAPTTPATPPAPEWDPADLPMDRQQRRAQSLALLRARQKQANGA